MTIPYRKIGKWLVFSIGFLILTIFSFQYFFSSTVPIGGDAPYHISSVLELPKNPTVRTDPPYPLSHKLFSLTKLLPLNWERRFIFWMCTGYLFSGILIGLISKKFGGVLSSITAMTFWAVSTWNILPFYRDGTLAQLWSMVFFLLMILLIIYNYWFLAGVTVLLILFCHPATFAITAITLILFLPFFLMEKLRFSKHFYIVFLSLIIITIICVFYFFPDLFPYSMVTRYQQYLSISELLESRIGLMMLLAPFGFIAISSSNVLSRNSKIFLYLLVMITFITKFNSLFGVGAWERRFSPYFISIVIILGSMGLIELLRVAFNSKLLKVAVTAIIIFIVSMDAWPSAHGFYAVYEGERSAMHNSEKIAYEWMRANLPANSFIAQNSTRGRGIEWLPVIANKLSQNIDAIEFTKANNLNGTCEEILNEIPRLNFSHIIFYKWAEGVPDAYINKNNIFKNIYENKEVVLFELPRNKYRVDEIKTLCELPN